MGVAQSEKSHGVFEDLTELANLGSAHGALFAWRGKIVIDTFFEIPFEQLHTLFHAQLFRAAPARLMELVNLDELTHDWG
jgi:hypothetical protein